MHPVRNQYEKFPYPPLHWAALPRKNQGANLAFELGARLAGEQAPDHRGKRILVAGAGTIEALVVATQHPGAREIVAVDLSAASLSLLRKRIRMGKLSTWVRGGFLSGSALAPIRLVQGDLHELELGTFDYIVASNVLHHVKDPAALFQRLAKWLNPGGLFRLMVYPKYSRFWLRQTSAWLTLNGVHVGQVNIRKRSVAAIQRLPLLHPVRSSFENNPEANTDTGIVDAYLHACENPLTMMRWGQAAQDAGLQLVGEAQDELSQSGFLDSLVVGLQQTDAWTKLEILDLLMEVCVNPVFWFRRSSAVESLVVKGILSDYAAVPDWVDGERLYDPHIDLVRLERRLSVDEFLRGSKMMVLLPSAVYWQLGMQCRLAEVLLLPPEGNDGPAIQTLVGRLKQEVGSRVGPLPDELELPGLSITDYSLPSLLAASEPWGKSEWDELQVKSTLNHLFYQGRTWSEGSLARQAEHLQMRFGATQAFVQNIEIR